MNIDAWLAELKIPRESYRIVSLLPLVYIAWADGKVQKRERALILDIARQRGWLANGGEAALEKWLSEPPTTAQLKADFAVLNELVRGGRDGEFDADGVQLLLAWCQDVADAAGGMLGLKSARTDAERDALKTIARALEVHSTRQWHAFSGG
jgi:hypothetical protein